MGKGKPVILGYDAVSPLGAELDEQWENARRGKSGVKPLTRFPLRPDFPVQIAGEVPEIDVEPYPFLRPRELALWPSPIFKHGLIVVHRAIKRAGLEITPEIAPRVATTFSTAIGGLDAVIEADRIMVETEKLPKPYINPNSCINMPGGKVSIHTGATGPILTTITACATGNTSMIIGAMLIEAGLADAAICGAVDFPLIEPIVAGFATMNGAYKRRPEAAEPPEAASRPFSIERRGFIVSEGAAAIVISSEEFAKAHGLNYALRLKGWGMTSDANHFVAPHLPTVVRCMAQAIESAGIKPQDINSVNAHAASTKVGDQIEGRALLEIFGGSPPPITANKSLIGHAMGASSAIESVFALEGMSRSVLTPTINLNPDPETGVEAVLYDKPLELEQRFVLKNGFGFGGCNACIVFERIG